MQECATGVLTNWNELYGAYNSKSFTIGTTSLTPIYKTYNYKSTFDNLRITFKGVLYFSGRRLPHPGKYHPPQKIHTENIPPPRKTHTENTPSLRKIPPSWKVKISKFENFIWVFFSVRGGILYLLMLLLTFSSKTYFFILITCR